TTVSSAIELPVEAPELKRQARRWFSVDLREVKAGVGSRLLLRLVPRHAQLFLYFLLDAVERRPVDNAARHEMQLHATQRVVVEIAQPLFWHRRMTGAFITPARLAASWKSPCEVPPSPKIASTTPGSRFIFSPHARPTAWGSWPAIAA